MMIQPSNNGKPQPALSPKPQVVPTTVQAKTLKLPKPGLRQPILKMSPLDTSLLTRKIDAQEMYEQITEDWLVNRESLQPIPFAVSKCQSEICLYQRLHDDLPVIAREMKQQRKQDYRSRLEQLKIELPSLLEVDEIPVSSLNIGQQREIWKKQRSECQEYMMQQYSRLEDQARQEEAEDIATIESLAQVAIARCASKIQELERQLSVMKDSL